jgi:hypothetical protein
MKVSTEIDNNFGYEKITQLVDNIPLMQRAKLFAYTRRYKAYSAGQTVPSTAQISTEGNNTKYV